MWSCLCVIPEVEASGKVVFGPLCFAREVAPLLRETTRVRRTLGARATLSGAFEL